MFSVEPKVRIPFPNDCQPLAEFVPQFELITLRLPPAPSNPGTPAGISGEGSPACPEGAPPAPLPPAPPFAAFAGWPAPALATFATGKVHLGKVGKSHQHFHKKVAAKTAIATAPSWISQQKGIASITSVPSSAIKATGCSRTSVAAIAAIGVGAQAAASAASASPQ